jgi:rhodanese-related sulfurtransferase/thiol-disulfide isomerase/thioredoxin
VIVLSLATALLLSACGAKKGDGGTGKPENAATATVISAEEAYGRMQSGDAVTVLDVRTAAEYEAGHIPGAILVPNEDIADTPPAELPVKDAEILVYCRSGNRSAQAAKKLAAMGYTRVYDFGGINSWPYETETGAYTPVTGGKDGTLTSFAAVDLNGQWVDQGIFADHELTMINIWATFCGPCLREMPELGTLAADYADRGVQVIGIVADVKMNADGTFAADQVQTARSLVEQTGANYRHLLPGTDLISAKIGRVSSVPETIFVDRDGQLVGKSYVGARSGAEWAEIVEQLLAEVKG